MKGVQVSLAVYIFNENPSQRYVCQVLKKICSPRGIIYSAMVSILEESLARSLLFLPLSSESAVFKLWVTSHLNSQGRLATLLLMHLIFSHCVALWQQILSQSDKIKCS